MKKGRETAKAKAGAAKMMWRLDNRRNKELSVNNYADFSREE